jgi:phosphoglycolate phosphatase-like HAD superfamily hydrolase
LLSSDPLHGEALIETVKEVYGRELTRDDLRRADHPGETATSGLRLLLRADGLTDEEIDRGLDRWLQLDTDRYLALLAAAPTDHWEAAPHAAEALGELGSRMPIGLLTGNPERMARARMERLGLARFFPVGQGAFGSDAEERADLIAIARRRAGDWPAAETVLVGDTPKDVAGAKAAGARAVGVTTGRYDAEELADADEVIDGLDQLPAAIERLSGRPA